MGVLWSPGDLPQQHAVNQSDLDRTGTCLVAAPANSAMVTRENVCVTGIPLKCKDTKRWIDGPRMKRERRRCETVRDDGGGRGVGWGWGGVRCGRTDSN